MATTTFIRTRAPSGYIVAASFAKAGPLTHEAVKGTTRHYGEILKMRLYRAASGRPGPKVQEDIYRNKFEVDYVGTNQWQARLRAYNPEPYSDRLEWGFTGVDSLGRFYNQPPFPHFRPAVDSVMGQMEAALMATVYSTLEATI